MNFCTVQGGAQNLPTSSLYAGIWASESVLREASVGTNFAFTNWNIGPQQFYRLAVP